MPTDRSQQAVHESSGGACFGRHGRMRHGAGMRDQAFHATQRFGQRKQLQRFRETSRAGEAALHFHRDDGAETGLLALRHLVARMPARPG